MLGKEVLSWTESFLCRMRRAGGSWVLAKIIKCTVVVDKLVCNCLGVSNPTFGDRMYKVGNSYFSFGDFYFPALLALT